MKHNKNASPYSFVRLFVRDADELTIEECTRFGLMVKLGFLAILICIFFLSVDLMLGFYSLWWFYLLGVIFFGALIFMVRDRNDYTYNPFLLLMASVIVFFKTSMEPLAVGTYMFYSTVIVTAVIFYWGEKIKLLTVFTVTMGLFIYSVLPQLVILDKRLYDKDVIDILFIANFLFSSIGSLLVIQMQISSGAISKNKLIEKNTELLTVNREKNKLVYTIAHDIKSPLFTTLKFLGYVKTKSEEDEVYLETAKSQLLDLKDFVEQVVDYEISKNKESANKPTNVFDFTKQVWSTLKYLPEAQNVDFQLELTKDDVLYVDQSRLRVVLSNLLANAINYHDDTKEQKFIKISGSKQKDWFYLNVEDNGLGISPKHQAKMFDLFYRGNTKKRGTGLGLYLVKDAVQQLSGNIEFNSLEGKGTVFNISIPVK